MPATLSTLDRDPPASDRSRVGPWGSGGREKGPARTPGRKETLCPAQVLLPSFPSYLNSQHTVLTPPPLKQLRAQDQPQVRLLPRSPRRSSNGALMAPLCVCSGQATA